MGRVWFYLNQTRLPIYLFQHLNINIYFENWKPRCCIINFRIELPIWCSPSFENIEYVFFNYCYFEVHIVKIMPTSLFRRPLIFLLIELFRVWVNGSGPTGTAGPGIGTHLLDPRVNGAVMVPSWVNRSGSDTIRTCPEPNSLTAYFREEIFLHKKTYTEKSWSDFIWIKLIH